MPFLVPFLPFLPFVAQCPDTKLRHQRAWSPQDEAVTGRHRRNLEGLEPLEGFSEKSP